MDNDLIISEIRNKLQAPKTALEMLLLGKKVPEAFIGIALKGIDRIVELLRKID